MSTDISHGVLIATSSIRDLFDTANNARVAVQGALHNECWNQMAKAAIEIIDTRTLHNAGVTVAGIEDDNGGTPAHDRQGTSTSRTAQHPGRHEHTCDQFLGSNNVLLPRWPLWGHLRIPS